MFTKVGPFVTKENLYLAEKKKEKEKKTQYIKSYVVFLTSTAFDIVMWHYRCGPLLYSVILKVYNMWLIKFKGIWYTSLELFPKDKFSL